MKKLDKSVEEKIKDWLKDPYDEETRTSIKEMIQKNPQELNLAFSSKLHFGTAGIREKMGVGPGRLNKYTIQIVTQALANYILTFPSEERKNGVVICYDSRLHSEEFAKTAASVLAGNGIRVHIVRALRPTPFASFAIRYFHAISGINITASHNPKEYNGYKVYWKDGAQVVHPHDQAILSHLDKIESLNQVKVAPKNSLFIQYISEEVDRAYLSAIERLCSSSNYDHRYGRELKIIYSPLNGCGITMIPEALKLWGFSNIHVVKEQMNPDGNFPTTPYPNPETLDALKLGFRDLEKENGDILLVSDPDSDRISLSVRHKGQNLPLTGNEMGAIMLDYLIKTVKPKEKWSVVTTIVSSPLIKKITTQMKGHFVEVLTGFKYIGEKIHEWEQNKQYTFFFGMEESLGFLYGTHARDKDATIAACLLAEIALKQKKEGKTLLDYLHEIYKKYGIYQEKQLTLDLKGSSPSELMKILRSSLPQKLNYQDIVQIDDYQTLSTLSIPSKKKTPLTLPLSDVLTFHLEDESRIIFRPSGTEPKLKIYASTVTRKFSSIDAAIEAMQVKLDKLLQEGKTLLNRPLT